MAVTATSTCQTCQLLRVPVKLHWSLALSIPLWFYLFMREWQMELWQYAWGASLVLCLVISLFIHECGHLAAMKITGLAVRSIVLHGMGGMTVPGDQAAHQAMFSSKRWIAVANFAAGPIANMFLAAIFSTGRSVALASGVEQGPILDFWHGDDAALWLLYAAFMNLALAVYNILPIYPLDGGHITYHLFSMCCSPRSARYLTTASTAVMGAVVVFVEALALASGSGSVLSLIAVALICVAAVAMSCLSSQDERASYTQLPPRRPVSVDVGKVQTRRRRRRDNPSALTTSTREVQMTDLTQAEEAV